MRVYTPFSEEQKKACAELSKRLDLLRWSQRPEVLRAITAKREMLCTKYPDARRYGLFSLFSGRDFQQATGPFDFPGADSIERFINRCYAAIDITAKPIPRKNTVALRRIAAAPRRGCSKPPEQPLRLEMPIVGAFKKGETLWGSSGTGKAGEWEKENLPALAQPQESSWWREFLRCCGIPVGRGESIEGRVVRENRTKRSQPRRV
jgi:hypothetical protein